MRGQTRLIIATAISSIFASLLFVQNASAAGNIGGRPALPRDNEPRSQSIFIHTIKKDQTIPEKVLLTNRTDTPQTVIVYATDAIPSSSGAFTCEQRAEEVDKAGTWIKLDKNEVRLQPDQSKLVDFTITAPQNADVGEHNACLAFESKEDDGELTGNLRIRTRSAVRVALTIPGKLNRSVDLVGHDVSLRNYVQTHTVTVSSTGNVSADTDVKVQLRSLLGGVTIYENGGQYPVLPREKLELSYQNENLPFFGGWYVASASATYDKDATHWGTGRTGNLMTIKSDDKIVFIMPQPLAIITIIAIIALLTWLIVYLIRRGKIQQEVYHSWKSYRVKEGETIQTLAAETGTSWKQLARVNKLKAPYILEPGSTIKVPKHRTRG